jgi:MurNAc alpha-1-phosphate uridylyltransferase
MSPPVSEQNTFPSSGLQSGLILAAGLGKRMQPLTLTRPKPLVKVQGRALLDYAIERLYRAGMETIVINVHYLAEQIRDHVRAHTLKDHLVISDETERLLDTGGGIKQALPLMSGETICITNSDSLWIEGWKANIDRMTEAFDPHRMDILLLLAPTTNSVGHINRGDFFMNQDGLLSRADQVAVAPFTYSGTALIKRALFDDTPDGPFSLNAVFDQAMEKGRLFGLRLDGIWLHVGTPNSITLAEKALERHFFPKAYSDTVNDLP